jgi:hypothetical protein
MRQALRSLIILLVVLLIISFFGYRFEHPKSGLSSGLGGANSTLALVHRSASYQNGEKVLVSFKGPEKVPALGIIRGVTQTDYIVQLDKTVVTVPRNQIVGHEILLLPFIGYIFSIVGL